MLGARPRVYRRPLLSMLLCFLQSHPFNLPSSDIHPCRSSLLCHIITYPADAPQPDKKTDKSAAAPSKLSLSSLGAVTRYPGVPSLLLMQAGANLAGSLMHSTFALVLQQRFQLSSKENGLVLSWVGVCIAVGESPPPYSCARHSLWPLLHGTAQPPHGTAFLY